MEIIFCLWPRRKIYLLFKTTRFLWLPGENNLSLLTQLLGYSFRYPKEGQEGVHTLSILDILQRFLVTSAFCICPWFVALPSLCPLLLVPHISCMVCYDGNFTTAGLNISMYLLGNIDHTTLSMQRQRK